MSNKFKRYNEYIGKKYGCLTITGIDIDRTTKSDNSITYVFADCDCGTCGKSYNLSKIKRGETKSCGHLKIQHGRQRKFNKIELFDTYGIIYCKNTPFYFDKEDLPLLQGKYWYEKEDGYLTHAYTINGKTYYEKFHKILMGLEPNSQYCVDHINRKRNDNRKTNIRVCTHQENDRNNNLYKNNTSGFIGVSYNIKRKKWVSRICVNRKNIYLGNYTNKNDAIRARLLAEIKYFGYFAPQQKLFDQYLEKEQLKEFIR